MADCHLYPFHNFILFPCYHFYCCVLLVPLMIVVVVCPVPFQHAFSNQSVTILLRNWNKLTLNCFVGLHRYLTRTPDPLPDDMDQDYLMVLEECKPCCYLFCSNKYQKNPKQWHEFFDDNCYNESEFREHFCLYRSSFINLYHLIKSHPVF